VSFTTTSTLYVSSNGDCGDKGPCYDSIQKAINNANSGSLILIAGGTYSESISLNTSKSLTLQGGWDFSFTFQTSATTLRNAPKAPQGSLTLQNLNIKP
jgi:pectin methylesterase-like acyl-CoA thioesterase